MCEILRVSKEDMDCVVQPGKHQNFVMCEHTYNIYKYEGVGWMQLNDFLKDDKLFLGVDPAVIN